MNTNYVADTFFNALRGEYPAPIMYHGQPMCYFTLYFPSRWCSYFFIIGIVFIWAGFGGILGRWLSRLTDAGKTGRNSFDCREWSVTCMFLWLAAFCGIVYWTCCVTGLAIWPNVK